MKIKIIKQTNICGKLVRIGDICDTAFINPRDLRTLLNCGCAVEYTAQAKPAIVETATVEPKVETANAAPQTRGKNKRRR